jgi:UDP-2-acetamido-3-amino-2,3-dideoxy-glucuronate N-acetyltransferase
MYMNYFKHETTIIDEGCSIGAGTKIWHFSHVMPGCEIGAGCNIGQNVVVSPGVVLGRNVKVQNNVSIYTGVVCEDDVFLGPSMVFTNVINPRSAVVRRGEYKQTLVRKGASIGANVTVVCGNEIGAYAMIGAGAVITKPVLPFALVVGNPARQIGWVSEFGNRLNFDESGLAVCEETGDKYRILDNVVVKIE